MIEIDAKGYEYKKWKGGSSFPVGAGICDINKFCNSEFSCHWHDGVEVIAVVDGEIEHTVNGESYVMREGDVMFVNSGSMHGGRVTPLGRGKYISLSFLVSFLATDDKGRFFENYFGEAMSFENFPLLYLPHGEEKTARFMDICMEILNLQRNREPCYEIYVKAELLRLWALLYGEASKVENERKPDIAVERVKTAVGYIEANYKNKIGLDEIAAACRIGRSELYRSFKRVMKRTPIEYVVDLRMRRSIELLEGGMSVTEAAMSTGFFDSSYYTKMFKRYVGCTPREYIKKIR